MMQDRAKYMPLIHQKYKTLKPQFPVSIQQREKFYLDMIYTLMTKNRMAEQKITKSTGYINSLEKELSLWRNLNIHIPSQIDKRHTLEQTKQDTLRKNKSQDNFNQNKLNHLVYQSPKSNKQIIIGTETTIIPNSQPKQIQQKQQKTKQNLAKSIDRKERRMVYMEDLPIIKDNPPQISSQKISSQKQITNKQKQFKQQIIKSLIPQPIYVQKKVVFTQQPSSKDSQSSKRSVSQNSLNASKTEGRLSYSKYLSQKPPLDIGVSTNYNIKKRG